MTSDFYVVLPSNSSYAHFPDNKQNHFKVKLQSRLPSDNNWLVGLSEIHFPSVWPNINNGYIDVNGKQSTPIRLKLQDGYYPTIEVLITSIHSLLSSIKAERAIVIYYDKIINRVILKIKEDSTSYGIAFSQNLLNILGLANEPSEFYTYGIYKEKPADINEGLTSFFIYSDIIENQIVGDALVPLLKVVPVDRASLNGSVTWITFQNVQYHHLVKNKSDIIEIDIRRDNGDLVPFENGKVMLTLHFKQ